MNNVNLSDGYIALTFTTLLLSAMAKNINKSRPKQTRYHFYTSKVENLQLGVRNITRNDNFSISNDHVELQVAPLTIKLVIFSLWILNDLISDRVLKSLN